MALLWLPNIAMKHLLFYVYNGLWWILWLGRPPDCLEVTASTIVVSYVFIFLTIRPGSVDSLNGGSTDAMKKAPMEK